MKEKIKYFSIFFIVTIYLFIQFDNVFATEGTCSSHGGTNCGIGSIGNMAVCNDGWISGVYYYNMVECDGFSDSCKSYLAKNAYTYNRNEIKSKLEVLDSEIKILKDDLDFNLYYAQEKAKLELQQSYIGRGAVATGIEGQYNVIEREYSLKRLETEKLYRDKIDEYNALVKDYNSICRSYTYEERNNICIQNFGSQYKYLIDSCIKTSSSISAQTNLTTEEPTQAQLEARLKDSGQIINPPVVAPITKIPESNQEIFPTKQPKNTQPILENSQAEITNPDTTPPEKLILETLPAQTSLQSTSTSPNKEIANNIISQKNESNVLNKIKSFFRKLKFW